MKTRQDFEQIIKDKLQGIVWRRLQNALLGKELISFGGVVNELQSAQYDNFIKGLSPEAADYEGLAVLGLNQFIIYDILTPAIAQIEIAPTIDIKPYKGVFVVGTNKFYNTEFYAAGETAVLQLYHGEYYNAGLRKEDDYRAALVDGIYYQSGVYQNDKYTYIKLPENTLVDSLRVYLIDFEGNEYPQQFTFVPEQENNIRVYRGLDNSLNVAVDSMEGYADMLCKFIVGDESAPDASDGKLTYGDGAVYVLTADVSTGLKSVQAARDSFIKHIGMLASVSTKEQVIQFVKTFPQVIDCMPELTAANQITVWVKPANERSLEPIKEALTVYGELAVMWLVKLGTPVPFGVIVTQVDMSLTTEQKAEIVTRINDWINANLDYSTVVTPAWVFQAVIDYSTTITLSLLLTQALEASTVTLLAVPTETTIAIVDEDGNEVGWDSRGYMRSYAEEKSSQALSPLPEGKCYVMQKILDNYLICFQNSLGNWQMALVTGDSVMHQYQGVVITTEMWDIHDMWFNDQVAAQIIASTEYILIMHIDDITHKKQGKLFSIDQRFTQQQNSLIRDPDQNVSWSYPTAGEWIDMSAVDDAMALAVGTDLFSVHFDAMDAYVLLQRYTLSGDNLIYQLTTNQIVQATSSGPYRVHAQTVAQWGDAIIVVLALYASDQNPKSQLVMYYYSADILTSQQVNMQNVNTVIASSLAQEEIDGLQVCGNALIIRTKNPEDETLGDFYRMPIDIIGSASSRYATAATPENLKVGSHAKRLLLMGDRWSDDNHTVYLISNKDEQVFSTDETVRWMMNVGLVDYTRKQVTLDVQKYIQYFTQCSLKYQTSKLDLEKVRNYPVMSGGVVWK